MKQNHSGGDALAVPCCCCCCCCGEAWRGRLSLSMISDHGNAIEEGGGGGLVLGETGRALKEQEEEEGMRMRCLCTIGGSREGSSICMRREKEPAWNGGALEQLCRCRQDSHRLHQQHHHHHHRRRCHSGLCVYGRDSEERVCVHHLHACCVKCNHCLEEGQVSKVR